MTCQWDRNWTASNILDPCDWVQCLKPPEPPAWTNLKVTDWNEEPIDFNGYVSYVCLRGFKFEDDPEQENVRYQCQDGSKPGTTRGFFNVPKSEDQWPNCVEGRVFFPSKASQ